MRNRRFVINSKENKKYNIIKLVVLIILLIISVLISFETGERIYNLINTSYESESQMTKTNIAPLNFRVVIIY